MVKPFLHFHYESVVMCLQRMDNRSEKIESRYPRYLHIFTCLMVIAATENRRLHNAQNCSTSLHSDIEPYRIDISKAVPNKFF